jgi:DNA-binding Lrp family transcriptional regulator
VPVTGTLGLFSLVDLFQLLAASSRSGRLTVDHPEGSARVFFEEGRVVHAEFGELTGEQAVYALFADEQGSFEFMMGLPAPRNTIETRTENLVLEATRRLDEARRDGEQTVDLEVVPGFSDSTTREEDLSGNLSLSQAEVSLLRQVDGRRSVTEIAKAAATDPESTRDSVQRLLDVGILKIAGRRPRTARLVAQITAAKLPPGTAGIDPSIVNAWQKALGYPAQTVACRRPDGKVCLLMITQVPKAGPYLMISRDTLMQAGLAVNQPLLVKPVPREES